MSPFSELSGMLNALLARLPDELDRLVQQGSPWVQQYGLPALGLGLLAESLFLSGFFFPGYALLIAAGYFVAAGKLNIVLVLILSLAGAILGDQLSYLCGRRISARLLARFLRHSQRLGQAVKREGPLLLVWYHFSPFLRCIVPLVCGHTAYPWRRFAVWDSLGLLVWIISVLTLGLLSYGALHSQGNLLLLLINLLSALLLIFASWRVASAMRARDLLPPAGS